MPNLTGISKREFCSALGREDEGKATYRLSGRKRMFLLKCRTMPPPT